jgi:hypothetical protein
VCRYVPHTYIPRSVGSQVEHDDANATSLSPALTSLLSSSPLFLYPLLLFLRLHPTSPTISDIQERRTVFVSQAARHGITRVGDEH